MAKQHYKITILKNKHMIYIILFLILLALSPALAIGLLAVLVVLGIIGLILSSIE